MAVPSVSDSRFRDPAEEIKKHLRPLTLRLK